MAVRYFAIMLNEHWTMPKPTNPDRFVSFNLEPTFRCNLGCEMCPRFSSEDPFLDMSMDTYYRIHEAMVYAHTVDFTGWGEPMLHADIYQMVRLAREQGCTTTMTSNGTIFNQRNSLALVKAGMDQLTVSVDGMTDETYNSIRLGTTFDSVTKKLKELSRIIEENHSSMTLGIAFTFQEQNAHELDLILPWMASVGVRLLHLKQLDVISNSQDWERSFLKYRLAPIQSSNGVLGRLETCISHLLKQAEKMGVKVLLHSEFPMSDQMKPRHCLATPLESAYFSYEGRMSPCCHFGHHVSRYFQGNLRPPSSLFFGDIRKQSFLEVWNDPLFQAFRNGFMTGDFPEACRTCYLLYGK